MIYPIFLTHGYSSIKILDASTYIDVANDDYDQGIMIRKKAGNVVKMMLRSGTPITEEDFNNTMLQTFNSTWILSATQPATEQDKQDEEIFVNDLENVEI